MMQSVKIISKPIDFQEKWSPLRTIRCLILSGYTAYEIQRTLNFSNKTVRKAAEQLDLSEKLFRNTFA